MTPLAMTSLSALLGLGLGLAYFALLRASLRLSGQAVVLVIMALGRLGLAGAGFWTAAQAGAMPLLAALAGFLAGRWLWMRKVMP